MQSFLIERDGYYAKVERERDGMLHGRVVGLKTMISFKAVTQRVVERQFARAMDAYFDRCKQLGIEPEKPRPLGL